jgi:hypothetical protein
VRRLVLLLVVVGIGVAVVLLATSGGDEPGHRNGVEVALAERASFVGSEGCVDCHDERHTTWLATAHAYSLRRADEKSVGGRFDGAPVRCDTFVATPIRRGADFYIRVEGLDGRPDGEHRVTRVVGRMFEQAYLFEGPRGAERVLPICWSIEREEWDLTHEVLEDISGNVGSLPPGYDTRERTFNEGCGLCHATGYDPGFDPDTRTYRSRQLEGAVACESCHGPGSNHVAWHEAQEDAKEQLDAPAAARLLHPAKDLDARGVLESCGRCHYIHDWRYAIDDDPRVGYLDIALSMNHDRQGFTLDGRLTGLNYHGSTQKQSACYQKGGMSCLSCHRLHGGQGFAVKWKGSSNHQCTQCHEALEYQAKEHTFHEAADAACVDCHMPRLMSGVLHFIRDHSIGSPEPELTETFGVEAAPNACGPCHAAQTATWAREWKEKWWGPAPRRLVEDVGVVDALRRDPGAVETNTLVALAAREESRLFFRMTALRQLRSREGLAASAARLRALSASEPELVQAGLQGQIAMPDGEAVPALLRLLDHPARTVRVDAAAALARAGWRGDSQPMTRAYREAERMRERQRPSAQVLTRIGLCADALGRTDDLAVIVKEMQAEWPLQQWSEPMLGLLQRHGRNLTEAGAHDDAITAYTAVRSVSGDELSGLRLIDSADSLAATGQLKAAMGNWHYAVQRFDPQGAFHRIARARLTAATSSRDAAAARADLEQTAQRLTRDPAGAELLRRVRWSLIELRGS